MGLTVTLGAAGLLRGERDLPAGLYLPLEENHTAKPGVRRGPEVVEETWERELKTPVKCQWSSVFPAQLQSQVQLRRSSV